MIIINHSKCINTRVSAHSKPWRWWRSETSSTPMICVPIQYYVASLRVVVRLFGSP